MVRNNNYNYISDKLSQLTYSLSINGKLNLLDAHVHSETFFEQLLNLIYGYNLVNTNKEKSNSEAIDLEDSENKVVFQVSTTNRTKKIKSSLEKLTSKHKGYALKFLIIANNTNGIKKAEYLVPDFIKFEATQDIIDTVSLLKEIQHAKIEKQKAIYDLVKKELGNEPSPAKTNTHLASIIDILSKADLNIQSKSAQINNFQINKKIDHNQLKLCKGLIEEYAPYNTILSTKYQEFDNFKLNTSLSVLNKISKEYLKISEHENIADRIFLQLIEKLIEIIQDSKNYAEIPFEELEMCVSIIVVDAFIRCKIFENPEAYKYVTT